MPFLARPHPVPTVPLPAATVACPNCDQTMTVNMVAVFDHVDMATTPVTSSGYVRVETQHVCQAPADGDSL